MSYRDNRCVNFVDFQKARFAVKRACGRLVTRVVIVAWRTFLHLLTFKALAEFVTPVYTAVRDRIAD